ncbi:hypothetical protein K501DRAFT_267877 [Backusella circina FSU 941]|nr:hypothetical protein K501DRAFT_267877 [Backusella circina FSU 941]
MVTSYCNLSLPFGFKWVHGYTSAYFFVSYYFNNHYATGQRHVSLIYRHLTIGLFFCEDVRSKGLCGYGSGLSEKMDRDTVIPKILTFLQFVYVSGVAQMVLDSLGLTVLDSSGEMVFDSSGEMFFDYLFHCVADDVVENFCSSLKGISLSSICRNDVSQVSEFFHRHAFFSVVNSVFVRVHNICAYSEKTYYHKNFCFFTKYDLDYYHSTCTAFVSRRNNYPERPDSSQRKPQGKGVELLFESGSEGERAIKMKVRVRKTIHYDSRLKPNSKVYTTRNGLSAIGKNLQL